MIRVSFNRIGADYFETLGIGLAAGRDFRSGDDESAPRVVIVNETMAVRFWPGEQALGKQFRYGDEGVLVEVVGVAKDVRYRTLGEEATPHLYLPLLQNHSASMTLIVSTTSVPEAMMASIQQAVQSHDRNVQGFFARTMEEHVGFSLLPARLAAALVGGFGLLALALALIGIYGVITYSVSQRTREIGIRVALGANRHDIFKLIIGEAVRLTLAGIATGLAAAYLLTRFLESLLFKVSATDTATFAAISLILAGVALGACFAPARRATKVDPMTALRYE
jgi:putative ABC transport system permease protein